jgi:hypothetical protein
MCGSWRLACVSPQAPELPRCQFCRVSMGLGAENWPCQAAQAGRSCVSITCDITCRCHISHTTYHMAYGISVCQIMSVRLVVCRCICSVSVCYRLVVATHYTRHKLGRGGRSARRPRPPVACGPSAGGRGAARRATTSQLKFLGGHI